MLKNTQVTGTNYLCLVQSQSYSFCLYFDLDVVILDNIDCFANFGNDETFGVMRDFGQPQMFYNSSILRFNNSNATAGIWKPFLEKKSEFMRLQGDQNVITDLVDKKPLLKMLRYLMILGHNHTNG